MSSLTPALAGITAVLDAFGRVSTSEPHLLLSATLAEDDLPGIFETVLVGGGGWTHSVDEASGVLDVGTVIGDLVVRQTYEYYRYRAFNAMVCAFTGHLGASKTNLAQRVGYFDAENGLFIEDDGTGLGFVIRTKTSGSVVDNRVERADWLDKMDGTGPSGLTVDFTKHWIMIIDFQWLGVGTVRGYISQAGQIARFFCKDHANTGTLPYMSTPHLPVRYELRNTGTTASVSSMRQICSAVVRMGASEEPGFATALLNSGAYTVTTTLTSIAATRLDVDHLRRPAVPVSVELLNLGNNAFQWYLLKNPTYTGSFTWTTPPSAEGEFDYAEDNLAITLAGGVPTGVIVDAGFVSASGKGGGTLGVSDGITGESKILSDYAGNRDELVLAVQTYATTTSVRSAIRIKEVI